MSVCFCSDRGSTQTGNLDGTPPRPDQACCFSFVSRLLVLPPVNKPFWFAVDFVYDLENDKFQPAIGGTGVVTTCFLPRRSSFWSQLNTGWIPLSPDCSGELPPPPRFFVLFAAELIRLPAERPVWDLLTWTFAGWVSAAAVAIGSSRLQSLPTFPPLIGRHCWGGQRKSKGLWDEM